MEQIAKNPEAWLGKDGVIAADGGASDGGNFLLQPIQMATSVPDCWFVADLIIISAHSSHSYPFTVVNHVYYVL